MYRQYSLLLLAVLLLGPFVLERVAGEVNEYALFHKKGVGGLSVLKKLQDIIPKAKTTEKVKIKLNDKLRKMINDKPACRALKQVLLARRNKFKFNEVKMAQDFLTMCKEVKSKFSKCADTDYEGEAAKIKTLLKNKTLNYLCKHDASLLDSFRPLDVMNGFLLTPHSEEYEELVPVKNDMLFFPVARDMLNDYFEATVTDVVDKLLRNASKDKMVLADIKEERSAGSFFLRSPVYKYGCETELIYPICALVLRTKSESIALMAGPADFIRFSKDIKDMNMAKIKVHTSSSLVNLDTFRMNCGLLHTKAHHMKMIQLYLQEGFLELSAVKEHADKHPDFNFYYELSRLCLTLKESHLS